MAMSTMDYISADLKDDFYNRDQLKEACETLLEALRVIETAHFEGDKDFIDWMFRRGSRPFRENYKKYCEAKNESR